VYKEGILIDKQVEIIGDGNRDDIVIEASGKDVVIFQAGSGRLANLTLHQAGNGERYAVNITKGRLDLEDCDIASQCGSCVAIHNGANPRLRRNRIHDGNDFGIHVYAGGQGTIEYNAIFANKIAGVYITTGSNPTLRRNHIFNNSSVGIRVWDGGGGIFEDNDLRGNARGAWGIAPGCEARVQRAGNLE
jgi:F-box protein 11